MRRAIRRAGWKPVEFGLLLGATACLGPGVPAAGQEPSGGSCAADFAFLREQAERNYAGYADKLRSRGDLIGALTDSVGAAAQVAGAEESCTALLQRWAGGFQDRHFGVQDMRSPAVAAPTTSRTAAPRRPVLERLDAGTVLLGIPSFNLAYKSALDSLLLAHREWLLDAALVILDIRGNGGGSDASYDMLIPFLYTAPLRAVGADFLASTENVAFFRQVLTDYPQLPADTREMVRSLLERAALAPGAFVSLAEDQVIARDTVYPLPRDVAILIDRGVASSGEEFLLLARQSRKVHVFGHSRSSGVLDYSNVRPVQLPSGRRVATIPTSRSRRLPSMPVDPEGLAPDVLVPGAVTDLVAWVRTYYRQRAGGS